MFQHLAAARKLLLDRLDGRCPDERSGMFIPYGQEFRDRLLQILHAVERSPAHTLGGQFGKPTLDEIKPTGTGGHQVGDETRMRLQPSSHLGLLVSPVVVHHQTQGRGAREFLVETPQKAQELLMAMTLKALSDDPRSCQPECKPRRSTQAANPSQGSWSVRTYKLQGY